jgi:hypothetical protein
VSNEPFLIVDEFKIVTLLHHLQRMLPYGEITSYYFATKIDDVTVLVFFTLVKTNTHLVVINLKLLF